MYFVLDENNNKIEALDKEGVLTALDKAIQDGTLEGLVADAAFVSKLKCCVGGTTHKIAFITQSKYNELEANNNLISNCYYFIIDDTTADDLDEQLKALTEELKQAEIILNNLTTIYINVNVANGVASTSYDLKQLTSANLTRYVVKLTFSGSNYCLLNDKTYSVSAYSTEDENNDQVSVKEETFIFTCDDHKITIRFDDYTQTTPVITYDKNVVPAAKNDKDGNDITTTYRKKSETTQYFYKDDLPANMLYSTLNGGAGEIDLSKLMLEGKTASDTIGISGTINAGLGNRGYFNIMWNGTETQGTAICLNYDGVIRLTLGINAAKKLYCTDAKRLIELPNKWETTNVFLEHLNIYYK